VRITNGDVALMMVQGTLDGTEDAKATYEAIVNPPKAWVEVFGTNHYGICDVDNPPGALEQPEVPTLDQDVGVETIARWIGRFFRAHVYGDQEAVDYVHSTGDDEDENVTVESVLP
jgi:hypothetical protein